jgi:hypothetical protein
MRKEGIECETGERAGGKVIEVLCLADLVTANIIASSLSLFVLMEEAMRSSQSGSYKSNTSSLP